MIRIALRGLTGRKLRAALTALAIVLGVAMMSGTYVLTDTIDKAFAGIFRDSYAGTDAVVTGKAPEIDFMGERPPAPPISEELLESVRAVPSVAGATGSIVDETATKILTPEGEAVNTQGAPSLGFGIDPAETQFNPLRLVDGRWPGSPREVVIDVATAEKHDYGVGDSIRIATLEPVRTFELVGVAQYGDVRSLGTATFAVFTIPAAQELLHRRGQLDTIAAAARTGVSAEELVADIRAALPASAQVRTGAEQGREDMRQAEFTKFIRYFLLAFAMTALFVGAFVIFNTSSITVAQRTREFATLRTIGASRRQILGSVVLESLAVGVAASLVGLFAGLGLAKALNALFVALDLDLPMTGLVFATRTVAVSLSVGIAVTLVAGLFPAMRATRVPPIAAVREGATLPPSRLARFTPFVAGAMLALALASLGYGMFGEQVSTSTRLLSIAAGCLALFVGVALLSSRLVRPLAAVVGWPATRIGGAAGRIARRNSTRNPGRTAATAAALMIGIALVTFVAVLANGMKVSNRDAIERQVRAEYVVTSQDGWRPFVAAAGDAIAAVAGPGAATSVRSDLGEVAGTGQYVTGIDPRGIATAYRFEWSDGSDAVLAALGRDGAVVARDFAEDRDLAVGDRFPLVTTSGERLELEVKGIYRAPPFYPLLGAVSIPQATFDELYERPRNTFTFASPPAGPSAATTRALEQAVASFPDARVQTREAWIERQDADFNQFLSMLYVLLALSVVISTFGMVNTLALSVLERTRELGLLRAVGMTRRQARRMVRHESVVTALIGAALGLPLGIFLAALVTRALSMFDLQFAVPPMLLLLFAAVAIVVGIAAAVLPARRAARIDVLRALQYE